VHGGVQCHPLSNVYVELATAWHWRATSFDSKDSKGLLGCNAVPASKKLMVGPFARCCAGVAASLPFWSQRAVEVCTTFRSRGGHALSSEQLRASGLSFLFARFAHRR